MRRAFFTTEDGGAAGLLDCLVNYGVSVDEHRGGGIPFSALVAPRPAATGRPRRLEA